MRKNVIVTVGVAALAILGTAWWSTGKSERDPGKAARQTPAAQVSVARAERQDVPIYLTGLGNVQAFNTVTIRPQVDGQLRRIAFREGQEVKAGDILAEIDPRSFQAALDQALAKRAQNQALLANARADMQRYASLVEKNYVARQQLDTSRAQVAQLEAAIQGDEAAIESARVTLGYATIRSPIDGRAGIRRVDAGNVVHASDANGLVVVSQMKPIAVLFTLPEDSLSRIVAAGEAPPVAAFNRDASQQLDDGELLLIDNQIDPATGTVRLKAVMPNGKGLLWPGQFVNARLRIKVAKGVLTVPLAAVQRGQQGAYCYVVTNDGKAEYRALKLAESDDSVAIVAEGVAEGEQVVTAGHYRLTPGARVEIRQVADLGAPAAAPVRQ